MSSFNNFKKFLFLNSNLFNYYQFLIFFLPIAAILGNFALNVNIILLSVMFLYFFKKEKIKINSSLRNFFLIISLFLLMNIFQSYNLLMSLKSFIGFLSHFILFLSVYYYFVKSKKNIKRFSFSLIIVMTFCCFDIIFQFFFGKDIFGYESFKSHGERLSGPFGDELVAGAYLSNLIFISLLLFSDNYKKKILYFIAYLTTIVFVIFLSQERSALYMTLFSITLFFLCINFSLKNKFFFFLALVSIIFFTSTLNKSFKQKYIIDSLGLFGLNKDKSHKLNNDHSIQINSFLDSRYGAHFLTAFYIAKDNLILGSGIKTFRVICSEEKYSHIPSNYSEQRCNTHPHNLYLEILSETGIIGILFFLIIVSSLTYRHFINSLKGNYISICCVSISLILFFPLQTTGPFFSSWNGFFYWIGFAVLSYYSKFKILSFKGHVPHDKN
jgi:O-antigen ligase